MTEAYPLQWPSHTPRVPMYKRERSRFDAQPAIARDVLLAEANRMGSHVVISSNQELRKDGLPYASRREPEDTGVAVYFLRKGEEVCIACDKYRHVWENMRAISKTIEAMRGIERWGSSELLDQAFKGFTALPSPDAVTTPPKQSWWVILGVSFGASEAVIRSAWKEKVRSASEDDRLQFNLARDEGLAALK